MKTCTKCKEEKELKSFNPRDGSKDGYMSFCRECQRAQHKIYHEREKLKKLQLKENK